MKPRFLLLAALILAGQVCLAAETLPEFLTKAVGAWTGKNKLMLHGEPARLSESSLTVTPTVMGRFSVLSYKWKFDGQDQEGMLLVGAGKDGATASWVDSWHNGEKIMPLRGESSAHKVTLLGSYAAPPGPDWKWRIELSEDAGQLKVLMTNITPKGEEEPAVEAVYRRK